MDLKTKIREVLNKHYGGFETYLENKYEKKLTQKIMSSKVNERNEWATYNQVILELKHSIKDMLKVKELQYKLTDNNNPNDVVIETIEEIKTFTPELERLYYKIRNF